MIDHRWASTKVKGDAVESTVIWGCFRGAVVGLVTVVQETLVYGDFMDDGRMDPGTADPSGGTDGATVGDGQYDLCVNELPCRAALWSLLLLSTWART